MWRARTKTWDRPAAAPASTAAGWLHTAIRLRTRIQAALADAFAQERDHGRTVLWLAVAFMAGIIAFFSVDHDPSLWAALAVALAAAVLAFAMRARVLAGALSLGFLAVSLGFLAGAVRVERVSAPVLDKPVWGDMRGHVESVEVRPRALRLVVRVDDMENVERDRQPQRVRVNVRGPKDITAGEVISVRARWQPPPGPVRPDGYDFARMAYFDSIGAVGSYAGNAVRLDLPQQAGTSAIAAAIDRTRNAIATRITTVVPGSTGGIAVALITGHRGLVSEDDNAAMRVAGLAHVLAISGLHMAVFAWSLFFIIRAGLALVPGLGARLRVKKIAALVALLGAAGYLAISGASVSTQRAFIMTAIVVLAIVLDRPALTLRTVATTAVLIMALTPEDVLGPSFQMSFAAVMALTAGYEYASLRRHAQHRQGRGQPWPWPVRYIGAMSMTTILAGLATAPAAAYHFQRLANYSLAGNILALPIVSTLVMPFAVIGLVLLPLGLDAPAWLAMGYGIDMVLAVARTVAAWPGAEGMVRAFTPTGYLLMSLALLMLTMLRTWLRFIGIIPLVAGCLMAATPPVADIYIDAGGEAVAVRSETGALAVAGTGASTFAQANWLAADADLTTPRAARDTRPVPCDDDGCILRHPAGLVVSLAKTYAALREDCTRADIVITALVAPPTCRPSRRLIDGRKLARTGAMALSVDEATGEITERPSRPETAQRAWFARPLPPRGPRWHRRVKTEDNGGNNPRSDDDLDVLSP